MFGYRLTVKVKNIPYPIANPSPSLVEIVVSYEQILC